MTPRRKTKSINVGDVTIGGGTPLVIQSMTTTYTRDATATIAQIRSLASAGCQIVRVATPEKADTDALPQILENSPVPIVADVHFHFRRALEAIEAGVHKIRLNPGNINDRSQVAEVIAACRERKIPIRIGVNEGSIVERMDKGLRERELARLATDRPTTMVALMLDKLEEYLAVFAEHNFSDIVIAAKSIDPCLCIDAYRAISRRWDYPLHLGVTHAGPPETGRIRSIAALATLLAEGIGDTLRISYAADPLIEVADAKELLACLGLWQRTEPELIACPTCGRLEVDLISLVKQVKDKLASIRTPLKVAVMGCVVNGPGEAEGADIAVFAGKNKGVISVQGEIVKTVPEDQIVSTLYAEACSLAAKIENGQASVLQSTVKMTPQE